MKKTLKTTDISRRKFIVGTAAAGGGLALGFKLPFIGSAEAATASATEVNAWVVVRPDSTCVIRIARSEMGQGTLTGLAQLVAEELECDWKKVATEHVFPGQNLARKRVWGDMATGGSRGIRGSQDYVRRGGAHDADAGGGRAVERSGRRAHRGRRSHHARGFQAQHHLRQGVRSRGEAHTARPEEHQAQGPERV